MAGICTSNVAGPGCANCDKDGDGLSDWWEDADGGVDGDGDNVPDLNLYNLGARPDRKDIFVEVDSLPGRMLDQLVFDKVIEAFKKAPVTNPNTRTDDRTGIALYIDRDEENLGGSIAWVEIKDPVSGKRSYPEFEILEQDSFGTLQQRLHTNRTAILDAKRKAFRHCVLGDAAIPIPEAQGPPATLCGKAPGTVIKLGTNRFFLVLGNCPSLDLDVDGVQASANQRAENYAGVLMHELGHTLGLGHGGVPFDVQNDQDHNGNLNAKPNYPSVMNYVLTRRQKFSENFWKLDYSRETLGVSGFAGGGTDGYIHENSLCGLQQIFSTNYQDFDMPFGAQVRDPNFVPPHCKIVNGTPCGLPNETRYLCSVWLNGAEVDFRPSPSGVPNVGCSADINYLFMEGVSETCANGVQRLQGCKDWANLRYAVPWPPPAANVAGTDVGELLEENEPSEEFFVWARENLLPLCPGVIRDPCDVVAAEGESAEFSVSGAGSRPIDFRWRKDEIDLEDGGSISGATTGYLVVDPVTASDVGTYDVVLTNRCGSTTSAPAVLTLSPDAALADCIADGRVDELDFVDLQERWNGPRIVPAEPCACSDLDHDGDIDLFDFAVHQRAFGPHK